LSATKSSFVSEIDLAARHDARGEHDDAINALSRATKNGDLEAMTQLGKRLIVGDRAPYMPEAGAGFILDAAKQGGGEAAAQLAVLVGAGVFVKQNWNDALNILLTAAERGWIPAQDQIRALASDRSLIEQSRSANPPWDIWRHLMSSTDFSFWTSPAEAIPLCDAPVVRRFENLIPPAACEWLVERARTRLEPARVYDSFAGAETVSETRTNSAAAFNLAETDIVTLLVQTRMVAACGVPLTHFEAATTLHYAIGQQITDHFDFIDPRTPNYAEERRLRGQRAITFLIYLNGDYEGGETVFPKLKLSHKGSTGDGLYFVNALEDGEPDLRTVHAGRPPSRGEKFILSQFIRDRAILGAQPPEFSAKAGAAMEASR
jgi:prolyl 4-hydroxylase